MSIDELYETVCEDHGVSELVEHARRQNEYCCQVGCGSGGCESCPCCAAGMCVSGADGMPDDAEALGWWLEVAAEHNPSSSRTSSGAAVAGALLPVTSPTAPPINRPIRHLTTRSGVSAWVSTRDRLT